MATHKSNENDKPLVQWIKHGDPELVPIVMADPISTAASYFGVPIRKEGQSESIDDRSGSPVSNEMIVQCSKETGIHIHARIGEMAAFDLIEFVDDIQISSDEEIDAAGNVRRTTTIRTPLGEISEVFLTPKDQPVCWGKTFVKNENDLNVLADLMERTTQAVLENPQVREKTIARYRAEAATWPSDVPLWASVNVPAFMVMAQRYMDPDVAFYMLADNRALMERVFEAKGQTSELAVEYAAQAGADYLFCAINGLELYSMDIYQRYFVPQARQIHHKAHELGMMTWVHTCGRLHELIQAGVHKEMEVDILESFSHPPLGDVADLADARAKLGHKLVGRGAVNVSLFYEKDLSLIRARTREVLAQTQGYRHMIGDTNDSYPPYLRENILALVDEVRKSGRAMPA